VIPWNRLLLFGRAAFQIQIDGHELFPALRPYLADNTSVLASRLENFLGRDSGNVACYIPTPRIADQGCS
jgi:hypothetical protein